MKGSVGSFLRYSLTIDGEEIERELGIPVKFIGVGEGVDDLIPFDPADFVDALLEV